MAISKEEIKEALSQMPVMDLVELIGELEEDWGVSAAVAAAPVAAIAGGQAAETVGEEKTEFDVVMTSFGSSKVPVIKVVRSLTGMGLKEAKELVESVPSPIKEGISKDEAEDVKKQLEDVGASIDIK